MNNKVILKEDCKIDFLDTILKEIRIKNKFCSINCEFLEYCKIKCLLFNLMLFSRYDKEEILRCDLCNIYFKEKVNE
jgi:hypothetical protein